MYIEERVMLLSHHFFYVFSCPFDRLTIYDGPDILAEKIGKFTSHTILSSLSEQINCRHLLRPDAQPGGVQHSQPALCHLPNAQENGAGFQPRIFWGLRVQRGLCEAW